MRYKLIMLNGDIVPTDSVGDVFTHHHEILSIKDRNVYIWTKTIGGVQVWEQLPPGSANYYRELVQRT